MNRSITKQCGFSLVELLVVIAIIALLAALLLPALSKGQQQAKRIGCINQLRQTGIAFQSFAHDHNGKFPMAVTTANGGSLEFVQNGFLINGPFYFGFRHFQALGSQLGSPKILVCPADTRTASGDFSSLQNSNVSYFVAVDADYNQPMSLLAGDANLTIPATRSPSILRPEAGSRLLWDSRQHQFKGNLLFADGHVEQWGNNTSGKALANRANLVLPTPNPTSTDPKPNHQPLPISTPSFLTKPDDHSGNPESSQPPTKPNSPAPATAPPRAAADQPTPADREKPSVNPSARLVAPLVPPAEIPLNLTPPPAKIVAADQSQSLAKNATSNSHQLLPTVAVSLTQTNRLENQSATTNPLPITSTQSAPADPPVNLRPLFWWWLLALILFLVYQASQWLRRPKRK